MAEVIICHLVGDKKKGRGYMSTVLSAKSIDLSIEEDLNLISIGFADDEFQPDEYIFFQQSLEMLEGEKVLGLDKVYIEHNDQLYSAYGGVTKVILKNNSIEILLDEVTAKKIKTDQHILILLPQNYDNPEKMIKQFEQIFRNEPSMFVTETKDSYK